MAPTTRNGATPVLQEYLAHKNPPLPPATAPLELALGFTWGASSQGGVPPYSRPIQYNNCFSVLRRGSKEVSYVRLVDFCITHL